MDALDLARWQFAITTLYHFLFIPITIGLSGLIAWFNSSWLRHRHEADLRLTKFFGTLLVINFALGLATGLVQEFQFGMNWSAYSRMIGDIFGAPLALEALLAFFLESTFLGVWLFGWGKIPERLHCAAIWLVHLGTLASAYFILAANSFMQHPVGYRFNPDTGRAEMTDFVAILLNKVQLVTFPHVIAASYLTGGAVVMAVGMYAARRAGRSRQTQRRADASMYRHAARVGAIVTLVAGLGVAITGDTQGKIMTEVQPMKMAAAEALYETQAHAPFSVLSVGDLSGQEATHLIEIPGLLSFLGTGSFSGTVEGINNLKASLPGQLQAQAAAAGIPAEYVADPATGYTPFIPGTYWSFRLMIGVGMAAVGIAAVVLWLTRRGRPVPTTGRFGGRLAVLTVAVTPLLPVLGNSFGWIFTEIGRQPWAVYGVMTTRTAVSPASVVDATSIVVSMSLYTVLYLVLAIVEVRLFLRYVRRGAAPAAPPPDPDTLAADAPLEYSY